MSHLEDEVGILVGCIRGHPESSLAVEPAGRVVVRQKVSQGHVTRSAFLYLRKSGPDATSQLDLHGPPDKLEDLTTLPPCTLEALGVTVR
eukprot:5922531-Amphidinium_carterae.1